MYKQAFKNRHAKFNGLKLECSKTIEMHNCSHMVHLQLKLSKISKSFILELSGSKQSPDQCAAVDLLANIKSAWIHYYYYSARFRRGCLSKNSQMIYGFRHTIESSQ